MVATPEEAVALLRSVLPWWGIQGLWGPALLATALCALLGSWAAIRVASAPLRRLPPDAPWYERARCYQPAQSASLFGLLLPGVTFSVLVTLERGPLLSLPVGWALAGVLVVALLASAGPRRELLRLRGRPLGSLADSLRDDAVALLLLAPHLAIATALALLLRAPFDALDGALVAAAVAFTALTAVSAGLPLLRPLGWVRPAPAPVRELVAATAERLGRPVPRVEQVRWSTANAFALPLHGSLIFTSRCLEVLDPEQLAAIAAHELGHLAESRAARLGRFAAGFVLLPFGLTPLLLHAFGPLGAAIPVAVLVLAMLGLQRLLRGLEVAADRVAHIGEDAPGLYARALEALYRDNGAPMVGPHRRAPHPHLYDRLCDAGAPPDHPRPAPPSRAHSLVGAIAASAITLSVAIGLMLAPLGARFETEPEARVSALRQAVALRSGRDDLLPLAMALEARGEIEQALSVTRAAVALDPAEPAAPAFQASLHARRRECGEAERALAEARARAELLGLLPDDGWLLSAEHWLALCVGETRTARRS